MAAIASKAIRLRSLKRRKSNKKGYWSWGYWSQQATHKKGLNSIAKKLRITCLDDWYSVTQNEIRDIKERSVLNRFVVLQFDHLTGPI